jgi:glucokinase
MGKKVFAVDLGGTNLRMAVVRDDGHIEHRECCSTPRADGPEAIVSAIDDLTKLCKTAIGNKENIDILGVAIPALMNPRDGKIEIAPNLPMLDGIPFQAQLEKALGLSVVLENDATAAAIGEHWLGSSRRFENSICVTLGTGVGGGIILNGLPLRGPDGTAGEIGHICVEPDGHPCGCGSWGCVEQYSSATAVVRIAREMIGSCDSSLDLRKPFTARDVYEAAKRGDKAAIETFRRMAEHLGLALAGLVNALNPDVIVFAGGMSAAWDIFIDELRGQITKRAFREPALRVKLVRAELGDDAGILGVASLALARADQGI